MSDSLPPKYDRDDFIVESLGEEIKFEKVSEAKKDSSRKYKEVDLSSASLLGGKLGNVDALFKATEFTLEQLKANNPKGLYTSTVNPEKLSRFKSDNSFTTMVRDADNNLERHAGFTEINNLSNIDPRIVLTMGMQAMAAVSGEYYLHEINSQISAMEEKLDEIFNIHEDEIIGKILSVSKGLLEIANRKMIDQADIIQIRHFKTDITSIYEQLKQKLRRYEQELKQKNNVKTEDKLIKDINHAMKSAFEADKLSLYADLIEIGVRIKLGDSIELIKSRTEELNERFANSFYFNYEKELQEVYSIIVQQKMTELASKNDRLEGSEKFIASVGERFSKSPFVKNEKMEEDTKKRNIKFPEKLGKFSGSVEKFSKNFSETSSRGLKNAVTALPKREVAKAEERLALINQELMTTLEELTSNRDIDDMIYQVIEMPNKDQEVLYIMTDDNEQRLFVPVKE